MSVILLIFAVIMFALIVSFSQRNPFVKSLDLPDIDEIIAMALAVHHSLAQSLEVVGIEVPPPSPEDLWQGRTK